LIPLWPNSAPAPDFPAFQLINRSDLLLYRTQSGHNRTLGGHNGFAVRECCCESEILVTDKRDPPSRHRRTPNQMLLDAQEIIRRHRAGEKVRAIARALGLPRTTVTRVIEQFQAAEGASELGDVDAEAAALVAKFAAGFDPDFTVADADPALVARLVADGVDIEAVEDDNDGGTYKPAYHVLAVLTADPSDAFGQFRSHHLPRTQEWWSIRNNVGQLLTEEAEIREKQAAGWRYRNFAWRSPEELAERAMASKHGDDPGTLQTPQRIYGRHL
jgi:Homeodomain-like domain